MPFTRYEDEHDFIGHHADKERDFEEGSYFVVFKFGAERMFEPRTRERSFGNVPFLMAPCW